MNDLTEKLPFLDTDANENGGRMTSAYSMTDLLEELNDDTNILDQNITSIEADQRVIIGAEAMKQDFVKSAKGTVGVFPQKLKPYLEENVRLKVEEIKVGLASDKSDEDAFSDVVVPQNLSINRVTFNGKVKAESGSENVQGESSAVVDITKYNDKQSQVTLANVQTAAENTKDMKDEYMKFVEQDVIKQTKEDTKETKEENINVTKKEDAKYAEPEETKQLECSTHCLEQSIGCQAVQDSIEIIVENDVHESADVKPNHKALYESAIYRYSNDIPIQLAEPDSGPFYEDAFHNDVKDLTEQKKQQKVCLQMVNE